MEVLRHQAARLVVGAAVGVAGDEVDGAADLDSVVEPIALRLDDYGSGKRRAGDSGDGDANDGGWALLGSNSLRRWLLSGENKQAGCEESGEE
jgi:hypothetical protein